MHWRSSISFDVLQVYDEPTRPVKRAMTSTAESIHDNLTAAHPEDSILVYKFTAPGGCNSHYGTKLLAIELANNEWLHAYQLSKSSGSYMTQEEIRYKAFPFIYDTRHVTNIRSRLDLLKKSLRKVFPDHYVNIFIFRDGWSRRCNGKGSVAFKYEYGSDVDIVLSWAVFLRHNKNNKTWSRIVAIDRYVKCQKLKLVPRPVTRSLPGVRFLHIDRWFLLSIVHSEVSTFRSWDILETRPLWN